MKIYGGMMRLSITEVNEVMNVLKFVQQLALGATLTDVRPGAMSELAMNARVFANALGQLTPAGDDMYLSLEEKTVMKKEEAMKLKEDDCVLLAAFVQKPSCGKVEDGSMLDKFGTIQLSAPNAYGNTVLRVLPEQVVSRCPARKELKVGDRADRKEDEV